MGAGMFVRETAARLLAPGQAQPIGVGIGSIYALSCRSECDRCVALPGERKRGRRFTGMLLA